MQNNLSINYNKELNSFNISFKGKKLIEHSDKKALIELAKNIPDFRMHPRSVANYKIKNKIEKRYPLKNVTRFEELSESYIIEFDNILRAEIAVINDRLEMACTRLSDMPEDVNHFSINIVANKEEAIYGCGEQFSYLNLRNKKVPMWTQEPGFAKNHSIYKYVGDMLMGAGGEWWTNYYPQALFVSSENYFVSVESYAFALFDFTNKNYHKLSLNEIPQKIVIDVNEKAVNTIKSLSEYLGKQRPLPDWIMDGAILGIGGGMDENDTNSLPNKLERALNANTKVAAVWTEDWTGLREYKFQTRLFWNWKYSEELYPSLPNYIKELKKQGIRFLGYNNCFLMYDSEIFEYAKEKNYLVMNSDGEPYSLMMYNFSAVMLDLTNKECWEWIKGIIKEDMIGAGLDGWMCDFAEYLPIDAKVNSNADAFLHHNEYPVLWAKVNAEAVEEMKRDKGEDSVIFFSRSGNRNTTKYSPLIWSGDQVMTYWLDSGLPAAINSAISMGFSGVGQIHADIAGEFGILWFKRSKDLFMRWTEYGAFTPVMRTHEAKGHSGWTLDSDGETLEHFAKFSRIHSALLPYFRHCVEEYQNKGLPLIRHPFIHYEEDKIFHSQNKRLLQYQYLLGRDIFVAPIIKKSQKKRTLYLPKDKWIHLWSGKEYNGGWVTVDAPIGEPPVFIRAESDMYPTLIDIKKA